MAAVTRSGRAGERSNIGATPSASGVASPRLSVVVAVSSGAANGSGDGMGHVQLDGLEEFSLLATDLRRLRDGREH